MRLNLTPRGQLGLLKNNKKRRLGITFRILHDGDDVVILIMMVMMVMMVLMMVMMTI
ncbi:hypothetical protein GBA52_017694 [Prunus armeniaca]|nr:hypothetical protein GBA52_017694 [Prunus armeniaca]